MSRNNVIELEGREANADLLTGLLQAGAHQLIEQAVEAELQELLARHATRRTESGHAGVVREAMNDAKISGLLLPGIGTVDDLKMAVDCGISTIRVATHCTEADVSEQHIKMASKINS